MAWLTIQVPDEELWSSVFGSVFEQYPWWGPVTFYGNADWKTPGEVTVRIESPDEPEGSGVYVARRLTVDTLVDAVDALNAQGYNLTGPEDWDANDADVILQQAVLSGIYYG